MMKWCFVLLGTMGLMEKAISCEIKLAPIILFMSKTITNFDWQPLLKQSNCSPEITQNILEKLRNSEGKMIAEQYSSEYSIPVSMQPSVIEVATLESILRHRTQSYFKKVALNGNLPNRILLLDNWSDLVITCENCDKEQRDGPQYGGMGRQEPNLRWLVSVPGSSPIINLSVITEVANVKKAFRAKKTIRANEKINPDDLIETYSFSDNQNQNFNLDNNMRLEHYELIRDLKEGDLLLTKDIKPKKLVTAGKIIDAIIKQNGIELSISAQAQESGSMGQTVQVKNLKNNKSLSGEIIGVNKVKVNL